MPKLTLALTAVMTLALTATIFAAKPNIVLVITDEIGRAHV